jgi:hypothetical protein
MAASDVAAMSTAIVSIANRNIIILKRTCQLEKKIANIIQEIRGFVY